MNLRIGSEILFALGRRYPRLPVAFLRAMPLPVLRALRAPAFRETLRAAARRATGGRSPVLRTEPPVPSRAGAAGALRGDSNVVSVDEFPAGAGGAK